ncbi:MAG: hypothetical protein AUI03_06685 [Nitrospirae bacterium 13_2_20CM_2_62_8]|nr:MAG: hypothetical protein AUI03_06685 [Nitrospirae bacterium 13_2_20CM_2_62_8]
MWIAMQALVPDTLRRRQGARQGGLLVPETPICVADAVQFAQTVSSVKMNGSLQRPEEGAAGPLPDQQARRGSDQTEHPE